MSNQLLARYYLARVTPGSRGYHPGKFEARVCNHRGRCVRLLSALKELRA